MKTFLALLACTALSASAVDLSVVGEKEKETPSVQEAKWSVQVEVLMVALPEEVALKFLPDLRDPEIVEAAVGRVMKVVEGQNAVFFGNPLVQTLDGIRGVSESILEKRYPTAYELPENSITQDHAVPVVPSKSEAERPVPVRFETRNLGITLEVEPHVKSDGKSILLNLVAQRVVHNGDQAFEAARMKSGQVVSVTQPQFASYKATMTTAVPNGAYQLIGVHYLTDPRSHIEFFIVRATATPLK